MEADSLDVDVSKESFLENCWQSCYFIRSEWNLQVLTNVVILHIVVGVQQGSEDYILSLFNLP